MAEPSAREDKTRRRMWLYATLLFISALLFSIWWIGPAPPRSIVLATGEPEGVYAAIGERYEERLDEMGLQVKVRQTRGSLDNLALLMNGQVDVAFVQAGTYALVQEQDEKEELRGVVAIQWEPVWVFYKGKDSIAKLSDFKGRTISIGQVKSGTAAVAKMLLKANGVDEANNLVHRSMVHTRDGLLGKKGDLDVGFFVTSAKNPLIKELMQSPQVTLFDFRRHLAYSRRFPFMSPVILGEGVLDLQKDIPPRDMKMFAVPTMLVCREDFSPHAVEQLLIASRSIHSIPELVADPQTFPTLQGMDIPVHETAAAYMHSGESMLTRLLPYWGVWLLFKLQIFLLPLILVWLPFFRLFPMAYSFRINWLLRRHYAALRDIEDRIENAAEPGIVHEQIKALDNLRKDMEKVSRKIPTHLQINVYQWRLHVSHVRNEAVDRIWHLETEAKQRKVEPANTK